MCALANLSSDCCPSCCNDNNRVCRVGTYKAFLIKMFMLSPLLSITVYVIVPLTFILWIPNPSIYPSLALKVIKSFLQNVTVYEQPESKIISTASLSKYMCEFESIATCAPKNYFMLAIVDVGSTCLCTVGNYVCLI